MGSDYLFGDCSQRAVSRFGCGKPSVIKQTLETKTPQEAKCNDFKISRLVLPPVQSEDTSATKRSAKAGVLSQGCLGKLLTISGVQAADGTLAPKDARGFGMNLARARQATGVILSEPGFA
jgi:hypothetical protein